MIKRIALGLAILAVAFGVTTWGLKPASATPVDPCAGGTLGYWPMDEGTGTVVHDICNGFDGSFSQGVAWATDAEGPYLQFLLVNFGDGPRVEVLAPALSQNTALTVELRMQTGGNESPVIAQQLKPDGTSGALRWVLKLGGRQLEVWGETGSNGIPDSPFGSFPGGANTWTHVAWQINGNQVSLYYDGVLRASRTLSFPQTLRSLAAITEFGAGERRGGFTGRIQFVRISSGIRNDFLLTRTLANEPPTAVAGTSLDASDLLELNGSLSTDPDGMIVSYSWQIIGEASPRTGQIVSIADLTTGEYTVELTVTDDDGATGSDTMLLGVPIIGDDTIPPARPNVQINENPSGSNDTVSGNPGDVEGLSTVEAFADAGLTTPIGSTTAEPDGSFAPISIGDNALSVVFITATDQAGNQSLSQELKNDIVAPIVEGTAPVDLETGVRRTTKITITFSELMEPTTTANAFSISPAVSGPPPKVQGVKLIFTPDGKLAANTTFMVTVAASATDQAGNPLDASFSFSFTTGDK